MGYLLIILIPVGYIFFSAIQSFVLGLRALRRANTSGRPQAVALRLAALNLCEPLINLFLVFGSYVAFGRFASDAQPLNWVLITSPMAVLLLPSFGLFLPDQAARALARAALWRGLLRWLVTTAIFGATMLSALLPFVAFFAIGAWLLRHTIAWGRQTLAAPPWAPAAPRPPVRPAAAAQRQPAITRLLPQEALVAAVPPSAPGLPVACPVCRQVAGLHNQACPACGLVFVSRVPAFLRTLPHYHTLRPLGDGGMSSVYLARDGLHNRLCVVKTLASVDQAGALQQRVAAARCLDNEAAILSRMEHPQVVRLLAYNTDCLVLEYIPGPTLADRLAAGQPAFNEVLGWGVRLADLLCDLAVQPDPLLHLDIKPANLILPPDRPGPVLVDFGSAVTISRLKEPGRGAQLYGTPGYAAPEQYRGQALPASDVYGLAATLYFAFSGDDPAEHPLVFPALATLPTALGALLAHALAYEPAARPAIYALRAGLTALHA